jgi:hypothetical protein
MKPFSRRQFLISAAALPLAALLPVTAKAADSTIHALEGDVYINNRKLYAASKIKSGDEIVVSHDGKLVFSIGEDAYLLRGGTVVQVNLHNNNLLVSSLRLVTGAVLGVFGKRRTTTHIRTATATIGIRGTAVYVDASPHTCYTCTCYGHTDLVVGRQREEVIATHHNAHMVSAAVAGGMQMQVHESKGHTDDELRMLEALVGRKPLFDVVSSV